MALCLLMSLVSLATSLNGIAAGILGTKFLIGTVIVYGAYFFFLIMSLVSNKFAIKNIVLGFIIFFAVVAAISLWCNPDIDKYIHGTVDQSRYERPIFIFFMYTFSGFVLAAYLKGYDLLCKYMEGLSYAVIAAAFLYYFFFKDDELSKYYMTFSYNMLIHVVFITLLCIKEFKIGRCVCAGAGAVLLLVAGCRGALVSYLMCVALYIITYSFNSAYKKMLVLLITASLIWLIYAYFENIILFINKQLISMDITSRTIIKLIDADFTGDSGRSLIQNALLADLNPLGHGFFADRVKTGSYAHNIAIEFIYTFGIVGGGVLLAVLLITILRAWVNTKGNNRILMIAFLSAGFFKLLFSSSFLNQEPGFYVLIGLCISFIKSKKNNNIADIKE